MNDVGL